MHHSTHDLLSPVPGITRQLHSFHFGPRSGGKVYIQASLHADELPGMLVAWHLKRRLVELEQQGRLQREIILVPVANRWAWSKCCWMRHWGVLNCKAARTSIATSSTCRTASAT